MDAGLWWTAVANYALFKLGYALVMLVLFTGVHNLRRLAGVRLAKTLATCNWSGLTSHICELVIIIFTKAL